MASIYIVSVLVVLLVKAQRESLGKAEDISLVRYIEGRILLLEDRLYKCEQDIQQSMQLFKDLSHKLILRLDSFNRYKTEAKNEMDNLLARLERAEWDIDYLETTTSSNACLEVDDHLVEKQVIEHEEYEEEKRKIQMNLNTSCNSMLAHIKSQKTVKKTKITIGSWMKNCDNQSDPQEIYFFSGAKNNVILTFANIRDFSSTGFMQKAEHLYLPFFWQGTGHALYHNYLFFHKNGTLNEIVRYSLRDNVTQSMELHGAGDFSPYHLSPFTKIDFAVDEQGLWTIHADSGIEGNIVLTKLNYNNLTIEHMWNTTCESTNAEAAFVICGTLYVMYNSPNGGRSHIDCIYDTSDIISIHETPTLYFPKRYSSHSSLHYNPVDQTLYGWDEGYQMLYKFDSKPKFAQP
ncbi:olfactomedin-like protein 1 isoform X1 [Pelobates fuscus]|uniref:olfactomedin-like protein 1 isoform X1 n=2 Tax=Pelobates fuscus TaxID=191477 RepID=UPI002FE45D43